MYVWHATVLFICTYSTTDSQLLTRWATANNHIQEEHYVAPNFDRAEPNLHLDKMSDSVGGHELLKANQLSESSNLSLTYFHQQGWPHRNKKFGAVTAVSLDASAAIVLFHRVDRVWSEKSFNNANQFLERNLGPINDSTIVALNRESGEVIYECGEKLFFMPHGLTVDHENNIWVTDVALHQVMKLSPKCTADKPLMVLGTAFSPGIGKKFCKPTAVAVMVSGDFFVADGYCNSRIVKFSKNGKIILSWGARTFQGDAHTFSPPNYFAVPHGLALTKKDEDLCVADRENGRVQCFHSSDGSFYRQYHSTLIGDRLFGVAYAPIGDGRLFVVNGPEKSAKHKVQGFVIDMKTKQILSSWGPEHEHFANPHDVAVMYDGTEVYIAELDPPNIHKFVAQVKINCNSDNTTTVPNSFATGKLSKSVTTTAIIIFTVTFIMIVIFFLTISYLKGKESNLKKASIEYSKLMSKVSCEEC